jgi:hypothetical protein
VGSPKAVAFWPDLLIYPEESRDRNQTNARKKLKTLSSPFKLIKKPSLK